MHTRHRPRLSLRRGLLALVAGAALVPITASADTPATPDPYTTIDTVIQAIPDGAAIDALAAGTGSKVATCVIETYVNRAVVDATFGDKVSCSGVVTSTASDARLRDNVLNDTADTGWCSLPSNSCSNDGALTPSLLTDDLTLTVLVTAQLKSGWTWASPPPGCSASRGTLHCTIVRDYPGGGLPPIVPVI